MSKPIPRPFSNSDTTRKRSSSGAWECWTGGVLEWWGKSPARPTLHSLTPILHRSDPRSISRRDFCRKVLSNRRWHYPFQCRDLSKPSLPPFRTTCVVRSLRPVRPSRTRETSLNPPGASPGGRRLNSARFMRLIRARFSISLFVFSVIRRKPKTRRTTSS